MADAGKFGNERVLNVRLALDPALQQHIEQTIEDQLRENGPYFHVKQAASVLMEPNGAVRAMVGGRDYGASQFNRATDAIRQPGSSFKPYLYLTAMATGRFKPSTLISAASLCLGKDYCPHNYDDERAGKLPLITALALSLNTAAIRLSIELGEGQAPANSNWLMAKAGRAMLIKTARTMGLTTPLPDTVSLPLGAAGVKMIEHASAYATFANGGKRAPPYATISVTNGRGEIIYDHDRDEPKPAQIFDPGVIDEMNTMLRQVVLGGTGRAADIPGSPGVRQDRHDERLPRRLVHGLHRQFRLRRLVRQRRLFADARQDDRRLDPGADLARHHDVRAGERRAEAGAGPAGANAAAGRRRHQRPATADAAEMGRAPRPATLSKASVTALGTIASTMRVAELGHAAPRIDDDGRGAARAGARPRRPHIARKDQRASARP